MGATAFSVLKSVEREEERVQNGRYEKAQRKERATKSNPEREVGRTELQIQREAGGHDRKRP